LLALYNPRQGTNPKPSCFYLHEMLDLLAKRSSFSNRFVLYSLDGDGLR
jgi:hypothetical protein